MSKRILFTEQELKKRENTFGKRLGRGLVKVGQSAKRGIDRQVEIAREERRVYDDAYKKARMKELERKAVNDARARFKKGKYELPF